MEILGNQYTHGVLWRNDMPWSIMAQNIKHKNQYKIKFNLRISCCCVHFPVLVCAEKNSGMITKSCFTKVPGGRDLPGWICVEMISFHIAHFLICFLMGMHFFVNIFYHWKSNSFAQSGSFLSRKMRKMRQRRRRNMTQGIYSTAFPAGSWTIAKKVPSECNMHFTPQCPGTAKKKRSTPACKVGTASFPLVGVPSSHLEGSSYQVSSWMPPLSGCSIRVS